MLSRRFRIQDVEPGMMLAKPAVTVEGRVVLTEGTVLTEKLIARLQNWRIYAVDISEEQGTLAPTTLPAMLSSFKKPAPSKLKKKFSAEYEDSVKEVEAAFEQIRYMKVVPLIKMRELADRSLREFSLVPGGINLLYMLAGMGDRLAQHSLNVAVIAGILGRWLGFSAKNLRDVILSALLHDVGKIKLSPELLNKKEEDLTSAEVEMIRKHPVEGYQLLKRSAYRLPFSVLAGVLQHHEWEDGTGYPLQLASNKIHLFAQVIRTADMYATMTSNDQENRMTPFLAVETMVRQAFEKLDPAISGIFLANIREQFIGNIVRLSDGREAVVVYLSKLVSERPVVHTQDGEFIDLEQVRNLYITEVVNV
ncbi:Cyclic di-GMP phosphodiesterase response regulator RpfG [Sporomusa ovata DSM 2662]|uniref:Response regulator/sensory box/HDIG domain protein n=1 Tax=Sporomusa ovata TaxID=2378 RepID=A0A0U1L574_9FIRM|nr:HD-GYP domain-containing protein [Sporomusa ovata]EQB28508.1 HD-GYP domain-containing protein [Sporomusa ovata DSM 2662]CQR74837.1 Response regulator/sensory box/HDIG domain protein [Sporomusa ovata]